MAQEKGTGASNYHPLDLLTGQTGDTLTPEVSRAIAHNVVLIHGTSFPQLAIDIAQKMSEKLGEPMTVTNGVLGTFANGEIRAQLAENMRGKHAIIFQSPYGPDFHKHIHEVLLMVRAAKQADAKKVTVVLNPFPYERSDKKDAPRVPIGASLMADELITAGVDRVISFDLHSPQIQGFFHTHGIDDLDGLSVLLPILQAQGWKNVVTVAPDAGGVKYTQDVAEALGAVGIATVYKRRKFDRPNENETVVFTGDVKGKTALIVDNLIDTAGTIENAANAVAANGATDIYVAATHGLLSNDPDRNIYALRRLHNTQIRRVFILGTVNHTDEVRNDPLIEVISPAELLAEVLIRNETGASVSALRVRQ